MTATLRCRRCSRTQEIEITSARAGYHFDQVAAKCGWRVHTILHSDGHVEAIDLCPDCIAKRTEEVPNGGAESPSNPGVGFLQDESAPAATGAGEEKT